MKRCLILLAGILLVFLLTQFEFVSAQNSTLWKFIGNLRPVVSTWRVDSVGGFSGSTTLTVSPLRNCTLVYTNGIGRFLCGGSGSGAATTASNDDRYVNVSGDTMTGALKVRANLSGSSLNVDNLSSCPNLQSNAIGAISCNVTSYLTSFTEMPSVNTGGVLTIGGIYVRKQGDTMTGFLIVNILNGIQSTLGIRVINTLSGAALHAENTLTSSGTLVWEGAASGATVTVSGAFDGAGLSSCSNGTTSKLLWNSTTKRFSCGTDTDTDTDTNTTYTFGQGLTTNGTNIRLSDAHSGSVISASVTLASSGSLVWEGTATGAIMIVSGQFSGAGLEDCDLATQTLGWDSATNRFVCGTDSDTTYIAGQGLTLNGNSFRLNAAHTGTVIQASTTLASSGGLVVEGTYSGAIMVVSGQFSGVGLTSCSNATTSKLLWNSATNRFSCGTDTDTDTDTDTQFSNTGSLQTAFDARYVNTSGDTMTGNLLISGKSVMALSFSGTTFKILGTASGNYLHAEKGLSSSGTLAVKGAARFDSAVTITEGALTDSAIVESDLKFVDAPADENIMTYEATTGDFEWHTCSEVTGGSGLCDGTDADTSQNLFETIAVSGQSNVVADSVTDTLTFAAGSNVTLTTNATTDTVTIASTDTNTTYTAGEGLSLNGTAFSRIATMTGTSLEIFGVSSGRILHAQNELRSSGSLIVDGTSTLNGALTILAGNLSDDAILEPDLSADNSANDGDILTYDSTGTNFAWITPSAGTDITADLEEETHASEHNEGGTDALTVESLASSCTDAQVLGGNGAGGAECQADVDTNTTYTAGQGLSLAGTSFKIASAFSGTTLTLYGTMSGNVIHAEKLLTSSGKIVTESGANIDAGTLYVSAPSNRVGIGTTAPESDLHILAANVAGFLLERDAEVQFLIKAYGSSSYPIFSTLRTLGTKAARTAVTVGKELMVFQANGYDGSSIVTGGYMQIEANEDWSNGQRGGRFLIGGRNTTVDTSQDWMQIADGTVTLYGTPTNGTGAFIDLSDPDDSRTAGIYSGSGSPALVLRAGTGSFYLDNYHGTPYYKTSREDKAGWTTIGVNPSDCSCRLSLQSGTAVTVVDLTGSILYMHAYKGNRISLYSGARWISYAMTGAQLNLTMTVDKNYDVFAYGNSTNNVVLELSTAWTSDTVRATTLTTVDGIYVKSGDASRRYIGTIRASGTNATRDAEEKRFVWNYYNRKQRNMRVIDTTNSWNYSTSAWHAANGNTNNSVSYVQGLPEDPISARSTIIIVSVNSAGSVGIGVDDSTANSAQILADVNNANAAAVRMLAAAEYNGYPGVGFHTLYWIEYRRTGTVSFTGDGGTPISQQTGLTASIQG